ncbi:MAG TPA: carboxypeptidase-like regulatory domain-containing protein, partial [Thermoanaerobaculia bacterium]|nr:carboxypeptidase-like regulatory domain-containing protein [Thermoanaerobaculia bacterium]
VTVCSPGFIPLGMVLGPFFPEEPLVLTLRPGAGLSGRLTGGDGLPIVGQYVVTGLVGTPEVSVSHHCAGKGWNETDAAGRFRVAGLEPGLYQIDYRELMALADGSREAALRHEWEPDTASLSGKLIGSDGQPMTGALVSLRSLEDHGTYQTMSDETSRTDADGNYRVWFSKPGLKIESLDVSRHGQSFIFGGFGARWQGPETVEAEGRYDIRVESFPKVWEPEAEIKMKDQRPDPHPVSGISGRILGLEPGELARVQVTASRLGWYTEETVASIDPDGAWRLEGLPRGGWQIHAEAAGRQLFETVHIPKGEARIARDLVFPPVAEVSVRVETLENEPVPGATVTLRHFASPFETRWPVMEIRTGSDGSFSARLPEGEYEITAAKEGFRPPEDLPGSSLTVDEKGDTATLWLRPAVELTGRLTGLPKDESEVKIEATRVDRYQRLEGKMVAEGRYVIPGLGPGTWDVEAQYYAMGVGDQEAKGRVVISEEATAAVLDLELKVPVP